MHLLISLAQVVFHCHQCLYNIFMPSFIHLVSVLIEAPTWLLTTDDLLLLHCTICKHFCFYFDYGIKVVCVHLVSFEKYTIHETAHKYHELTKLCSVLVLIQAFMHLHHVTVAIC